MLVFFVDRQDKVALAQRHAFPTALVEVEQPTGLGGEVGVARKDSASVAPRAQRLAAEPLDTPRQIVSKWRKRFYNLISNGLFWGIPTTTSTGVQGSTPELQKHLKIRHRIYNIEY
jgi:hypothetical protein